MSGIEGHNDLPANPEDSGDQLAPALNQSPQQQYPSEISIGISEVISPELALQQAHERRALATEASLYGIHVEPDSPSFNTEAVESQIREMREHRALASEASMYGINVEPDSLSFDAEAIHTQIANVRARRALATEASLYGIHVEPDSPSFDGEAIRTQIQQVRADRALFAKALIYDVKTPSVPLNDASRASLIQTVRERQGAMYGIDPNDPKFEDKLLAAVKVRIAAMKKELGQPSYSSDDES